MRTRSLLFICAVLAVLGGLVAWTKYHRADPVSAEAAMQPAAKAQDPAQGQDDGGKPAVAVKVVEVTEGAMPIRRRTIGWVEPIATVAVKSRVNSVIMEQRATDGQFVKQGDVLFVLDDREAKAAIARDQAAMAQHQAEVDRAHADARAAEAAVAADQAVLQADKLTLSYTTIFAPIAGRLGAVAVTPGNLVGENAATSLVTITQMQPIRVSFTLPDRDIDALRTALAQYPPAPVRVFVKGDKTPRAKGNLSFIDSSVDVASGTITAKAEFANDNLALWPGQYFDVDIELGLLGQASIIPSVALQVGQNGLFVFVIKPDDTAEMRTVTVAGNDGDKSAIATGLQPGEKVVVDGQHQLSPGAKVTVVH